MEREPEVRRAAVLVVKATLSGLGQDAIQVSVTQPTQPSGVWSALTLCGCGVCVLCGMSVVCTLQLLQGELRSLYHLLKRVESTEVDDLTRGLASTALGELDQIVRGALFPPQLLVKELAVLRPPR